MKTWNLHKTWQKLGLLQIMSLRDAYKVVKRAPAFLSYVYIYVYVCINKNFQSKSAEVSFQSPFSPIPTLLSPFRLFFTENKKRHRFQSFGLQTVFKIPSTLMFLASGFQTIAILPKRATCLQIVCEITFKSNVFPEQFYF